MTNQNNHPNNDMKAVRGLGQLPNASTKLPTLTNQNNELDQILNLLFQTGYSIGDAGYDHHTDQSYIEKAKGQIEALYAPKPVEKVNKTPKSVDLTKPEVNLIDIASPNMTPEASKVVSDAIERSAEAMNKKPVENGELREQLAAIEHERWADWQKWCHKVLRENNPSPEQGDILERWDRQIETPYAELSEAEKQSDRDQVDRYWQLVEAYLAQEKAKWNTELIAEFEKLLEEVGRTSYKSPVYNHIENKVAKLRAKLLDKENTK